MVIRTWGATTGTDKEKAYLDLVNKIVLPYFNSMSGYKGSYFLRSEEGGKVEFKVLTFWESMATAKALAGADPTKAFVPLQIAETLDGYDTTVNFFDVVIKDGITG